MKKLILTFALLIINFSLFSQAELTNLNTSWSQVMGGTFLQKPETNSYGFIGITDGKTLISISNNGNILWEKNYSVNRSSLFSTISDDFTVLVTNSRRKITLINPSGTAIWTKVLDWEISEKPFEGRDGRFFIKGNKNICCFGINGICKWSLELPETSDISLQELPDGSIVVFLKALFEGKSKAIRISPFGKQLEEIIFAGEVLSAVSCEKGIFLTFSDGSSGLFALENGKAINKYVLSFKNGIKNKNTTFISDKSGSFTWLISDSGKDISIFRLDAETGNILAETKSSSIIFSNITEETASEKGLFLSDKANAVFIDNNGNEIWTGILPSEKSKNKWSYALFTQNLSLVLFLDNWTINGYVVSQSPGKRKNVYSGLSYKEYFDIDTDVYNNLYHYSLNKEITGINRYEILRAGLYGDEEIEFTSDVLSAVSAYIKNSKESDFGIHTEISVFKTESKDMESLFTQLPLYGTKDISSLTAKLLESETNKTLLNTLILGLGKNGYDPDGEILKALENLAGTTSVKDVNIRMSICDAVYSICRFMGRPAFNRSGKIILSNFLYPSNNSRVRNKARETLKKIQALEL